MPHLARDAASASKSSRVKTKTSYNSKVVDGSSADRAYAELKRRILDNELAPGDQLLEQEGAVLLGMSRTPIREAMVRLAQEGLIEIRPRHGMRVARISPDDMREIYEILTALESYAAEAVAMRGVSASEFAPLEAALSDMEMALQKDDLVRWAKADERFHSQLVELAGNKRLSALVSTYREQSHRVRMTTLRMRPKPAASNRDHAALIKAIRKRDPELARRIHHGHRQTAGRVLIGLLQTHRLKNL
jgi:DNA-binding GntR family transcriptional regulator